MVTSWPKGRAGPGVSAKRIADRINAMAGGRLQIDLFAAGEIVPPLAVLDAVSNGTVEIGHTAALYWQGKIPAAGFFTTVPFGLGPVEHEAWIELRDGQALWDELYRPHGVRAFLAGNTGPSMGGWFRQKLAGPDDLKGMRIRVQGLGAEVFRRLGAVPMTVAAGDLLPALERGSIDAAEFLAPATDLETGLHKNAPFYYAPGFNKPNGASELHDLARRLGAGYPRICARSCARRRGPSTRSGSPTRTSATPRRSSRSSAATRSRSKPSRAPSSTPPARPRRS